MSQVKKMFLSKNFNSKVLNQFGDYSSILRRLLRNSEAFSSVDMNDIFNNGIITNYRKFCLYPCLNEDLMENYNHIIRNEKKALLSIRSLLDNICFEERDLVINWIVNVQKNVGVSERDLYKAIRLFDKIISKDISLVKQYKFVAAMCLWIVNKQGEKVDIPISKIQELCDSCETAKIIQFEMFVMKETKNDPECFEPYTILYHFLELLGLINNKLVCFGCHFLIEIMMFSPNFSTIPPSILSICVLIIVLQFYGFMHLANEVKEIVDKKMLASDKLDEEVEESRNTLKHIIRLTDCSEVISKYMHHKYFAVSKELITL